jgi:hypothetical protein
MMAIIPSKRRSTSEHVKPIKKRMSSKKGITPSRRAEVP